MVNKSEKCTNTFFSLCWDDFNTQGEFETLLIQTIGGKHRFILGNEKAVNACEILVQARRLKVYHSRQLARGYDGF